MNTCKCIALMLLCLTASATVRAGVWMYDVDTVEVDEIPSFVAGGESVATDVNNIFSDPYVVGWARLSNGTPHAFFHFHPGGSFVDITPELGPNVASYAQGINDAGEVVGYYEDDSFVPTAVSAFYWVNGGGPSFTLLPGIASGFRGRAININGAMAGEFFGTGPLPANPNSSCYGTLPVRWFLAYQAPSSIFCVQSGNELRTTGINDDGHVVGWERPTPSAEYRSWISRNGVKTIVPKPGAPKGSTSICGMKAAGMNRYDVVVGSASVCYPSSTIQRGYMWNGLSTSSLLLGVLPGGNSSQAYDVNAWRIITGSSEQLVEGGPLPDLIRDRAFVYHATMGMVALPIPEGYVPLYTDCEALAVSALDYGDYAHIAGYCTKNSKKHAVVWKVRFEKTYLELNF